MYGYCIYLTSGQTIEGEIEDASQIESIMGMVGRLGSETPVAITDSEGKAIIIPKYITSVAYWELTTKNIIGYGT